MMKATKFLFGAMLMMTMVACTNKESLIKDYETACSKGQVVKAVKLAQKIEDKYGEDLTVEELERIAGAALELETKSIEGAAKMLNGANSMFEMFGSLEEE